MRVRRVLFAAAVVAVLAAAGLAAPAMHFHGHPAAMHYHGGPQLRLLAADPGTGHAAMIARNHTYRTWGIFGRNPVNSGLFDAYAAMVARRACSGECIQYQGSTNQPGWFQAKWTANTNTWYLRGVAKCGNGTRNTILKTGGWVRSTGLWSRATCTSSYPNLNAAGYDVKHCSTCSFTRTWVPVPPVASFAGRMHYFG